MTQQRISNVARICLAILALGATVGCGESMQDVQGRVTLDGQPLVGVNVTFEESTKHVRATGTTDENGVYRLSTNTKDDGALPGDYLVTISQPGPADSSQAAPPRMFPEKYERTATSGLSFTVKGGSNKIDIPLVSE